MKSIVLHAWTLQKKNNNYLISYSHWIYLNEIVKYYDEVCLLSPVLALTENDKTNLIPIKFSNVTVYELPYSNGYIDAVKYFFKYVAAYRNLSRIYNKVYARYPIPFGWLQKYFFKDKSRIIHFVGDPADTIINNPNISKVKKKFYTTFFKPEHLLFMNACKGAIVFTNGFHLAERLEKYEIKATPLISSTLNSEDFHFEQKEINADSPKLIYVGYLRKAKGIETVLKSYKLLKEIKPNASLTIVGKGELDLKLRDFVSLHNLTNVTFEGHVSDRKILNSLLRSHDIFAFGSLSEGSPRVILEAMANGLAVVSTPVGSLPTTFIDKEEILFADFNDEKMFLIKYLELVNNSSRYNIVRSNSFKKVSDFTIDKFLKTIFYEA